MTETHKHDKKGLMCNHVAKGKRPLRMVAHDREGIWQFMCGHEDHSRAKQAKRVCVACIFDKNLRSLTPDQLPPGHIAERDGKGAEWVIRDMTDEELGQISDTDTAPIKGMNRVKA
ncbi:hypothetical protein ACW9UR_20425 [Halovulum sp. GXIMD14794]